MFTKLATSAPQSRLAQRAPLQRFTGTVMPSFSKWCRKAIPRWIKREECDDGVDEDMWDKNSMWFLENKEEEAVEEEEEEWDEWDEKAMLDIAHAVADVVAEVDDEVDIFEDSAEFDEASFYSDDSASWDSEDKATGDGDGEDDGIYDLYLEI